ncbi:hypothetical protein AS594_22375 [Streptomyces agglomeratus]|uniref:Uncharacterized protein n=1 Tax=Streptomyces agglomeratus TaxID=285458 RepID=A0A1E5PB81_9ACTN|nr:hypothetical protein AS594_22375 [Streptomyces agglomeratus]
MMAKQGHYRKLRGKQGVQAQMELNQLWELTRQHGVPPYPIPGAYAVAALVQDGECQADEPPKPFWGPIGREGYLLYCCTHRQEHCYRIGYAE